MEIKTEYITLTILVLLIIWLIVTHKRMRLFSQVKKEKFFNINSSMSGYSDSDQNELDDRYLVDFRADRFAYGGTVFYNSDNIISQKKTKIVRVEVKPKDILEELSKPPTKWSLEGINDKIDILKEKEAFIKQQHAKREVSGLITCLENRKKFDHTTKNGKTFREYFSQFDTTDERNIEKILKKYTLKMGPADIFIPEFPDDAVKIMKEYKEKIKELCDKEPRYYVIALEKDFQKQDEKRDPILLSQSPFGFYYYILGVWDTEMLYLPEL